MVKGTANDYIYIYICITSGISIELKKVFENAIRFEKWTDRVLVHVVCKFIDIAKCRRLCAHITSVSKVKKKNIINKSFIAHTHFH